jgi:hypothetical protein
LIQTIFAFVTAAGKDEIWGEHAKAARTVLSVAAYADATTHNVGSRVDGKSSFVPVARKHSPAKHAPVFFEPLPTSSRY